MISTSQKLLAIVAHISYLFGGLGFVLVPLIIFMVRKDEDAFVAEHAKQAFCVQASFAIVSAAIGILTFLLIGILFYPLLFLLGIAWGICSLIAAWRALNGEDYRYPFMGPLVRRLD
jgi:uncharacterized protein